MMMQQNSGLDVKTHYVYYIYYNCNIILYYIILYNAYYIYYDCILFFLVSARHSKNLNIKNCASTYRRKPSCAITLLIYLLIH